MNNDKISHGLLVSRKKLGNIQVPSEILEKLSPEKNNFLAIFTTKMDNLKINIIPYNSKKVLKLILYLESFSPNAVKSIAEIIYDLNIKTIYTSGICFNDNECCYEAYVEIENEDNLDVIKNSFLDNVEGCKSVELFTLKMP
ncbi:MAG: hypothetical protein ACTSWN_06615 [Promethearchaeota archaeon]